MKPTWEREGIKLYLGDCMDVLPELEVSVDLVITSPPYNCGMDYGIVRDDLPVADYFSWFEAVFCHVTRTVKNSGRMAVNVPSWIGSRTEQVFAFDEYRSILDRLMFFRDAIVWDKGPPNGAAWGNYPTSPRIRAGHEWILVYQLGTESTGESDISWENWSRFTQSLWRVPATLPYSKEHPATFPVEIPSRLALLYSPVGGQVLDPFAGTGTTVEACVRLGRKCIAIEKSPRFFELMVKRIGRVLSEERSSLFPVSKETQAELF